jgi:methylmalonyl-CoA mutase
MLDQTLVIGDFFPTKTISDWEKMTKEVLKTDDLDRKLLFKSVEGIDLYPLHVNSQWICELNSFPENVEITSSNISNDKNIINLTTIHNSGASIIQEIYFGCIQFVEQIKKNTSNIEIHIALDSLYFSNIAKVRALRYIFEKLIEENKSKTSFTLISHNSLREQTLFDPWVNMLRSTASSMAAILGGANKISSYSYDHLFVEYTGKKSSSLGSRNAENELKILLEESHLDRVSDPMKGSHSIEAITHELIEKSWGLLIENVESFDLNSFAKEVEKTATKRYKLAQSRKITITGVNNFANPEDSFQKLFNTNIDLSKRIGNEKFPLRTVAFEFETIRNDFKAEVNPVKVLVLDSESKVSARINFCRNYFEVIGANVTEVKTIDDIKENDHIIICGTDETYEKDLSKILKSFKAKKIKSTYVAGKIDITKYQGITDSLYLGQNIFEVLSHFTKELC